MSPMKLTAGEIYFLGERDKKNDKVTNYVKIGIVREGAKGPRTSLERLVEHQTGNPRELFLHRVITTPAVEEVETRLHKIFAKFGVSGEWFLFDSGQLKEAIEKALELRDETKKHLKAFVTSEELKKVPSNGSLKSPGAKARHWYEIYVGSNVIIKEANRLKTIFGPLLLESVDTDEEVEDIVIRQTKEGSTYLDIEKLSLNDPNIYKKYLVKNSIWQQRFSVKISKSNTPKFSDIDPAASKFFTRFETFMGHKPETQKDREALHDQYLEILKVESLALWNKQIAEAQLKVLCADSEGIDGICTWSRATKEIIDFDSVSFEEEQPKLFKKYLTKRQDVKAITIVPKKGY